MTATAIQQGAQRSFFSHPTLADVICIRLGDTDAVAIFDAEDLPLLSRYAWQLHEHPDGLRYAGSSHTYAGRKHSLLMHRVVLMVGPSRVVDHINRDGLDNRKANLRACSLAQNLWNAKLSKANKTGVKGLYFESSRGGPPWRGRVAANGVRHERRFHDRVEAEQWLALTRSQLHGEFARHA